MRLKILQLCICLDGEEAGSLACDSCCTKLCAVNCNSSDYQITTKCIWRPLLESGWQFKFVGQSLSVFFCLKPLHVSACFLSELGTQLFLTLITVTQTMLVKLQPASGTRLPPYNPVLPPPAVSQVLLLANPQRVSYMHVTVTACLPWLKLSVSLHVSLFKFILVFVVNFHRAGLFCSYYKLSDPQ